MSPDLIILQKILILQDETLSPTESILIAQQIANAAQYLHQFGYVHSNISSHCVLMCNHRNERQLNVKLSSFELVTAIDHRSIADDIECKYGQIAAQPTGGGIDRNHSGYSFVKHRKKALLDKYRQRSKELAISSCLTIEDHSYLNVRSEHLPYNLNYRQHLCQFNYQAPELLTNRGMFVFPTIGSDVYAVTALTWEMVNSCVPYAVYTFPELEALMGKRQAYLPMFDSTSKHFTDIFTEGLECNPNKRTMNMDVLMERLEEIKVKTAVNLDADESIYQNGNHLKANGLITPPSSRLVNVTIDKPLPPIPMSADEIDSIKERTNFTNCTLYQSLLEFNKFLKGTVATPAGERTSTMKKHKRISRKDNAKPTRELFTENEDSRISSTRRNDTMDELNQNLDIISNKSKEITQTKPHKSNGAIIGPLLIKENHLPTKVKITHDKTKFLNKLISPRSLVNSEEVLEKPVKRDPIQPHRQSPRKSALSKSVEFLLNDTSDDTSPKSRPSNDKARNSAPNSEPNPKTSSYRFAIGDFSIPNTPIARKNKIRRNAWLSDQQLSIDEDAEQSYAPSDLENSSAPVTSPKHDKSFNVSIKIVRNKVTPIATCETSAEEPTQVNPLFFDERPLTPHRLSFSESMIPKESQLETDLTKELNKCLISSRYDNVSNDFLDIVNELESKTTSQPKVSIQPKETLPTRPKQSLPTLLNQPKPTLPTLKSNGAFEKHWRIEKDICLNSESMIDVPKVDATEKEEDDTGSPWTPVKDTIQQFENWLSGNKTASPLIQPVKNKSVPLKPPRFTNGTSVNKTATSKSTKDNTPNKSAATRITRTIYRESVVSGIDLPASLIDANGSKSSSTSNNNTIGRKLTTCVTMNMRKTRRRSSDLGLDGPKMKLPQNRHSICGNDADLIDLHSFCGTSTLAKTDDAKACSRARQNGGCWTYVCCKCENALGKDDAKACKCFATGSSASEEHN